MTRQPIVRSIIAGAVTLPLLAACAGAGAVDATPVETSTPSSEEGVPVNFLELNVGDCFDIPTNLPSGEALRYSSCEVLHVYEAYAEFHLDDGPFPGADAVDAAAGARCEPAFREFVGEAWQSSEFDYQFIVPSQATWDDLGDRSVLCMVNALDGLPSTGSARGAGR